MKLQNIALLGLMLFPTLPASAQSDFAQSSFSFSEPLLTEGWTPYFGLSTGYMTRGGQYETEGVPTSFKALGSYHSGDWIFDIGGGLQHQFMSNGRSSTLPLLEASARLIAGGGWQMGPVWNTYLADSLRYGSANTNFTSFIGLQAARDFRWQNQPLRAGGSVMTDLDIRNEQVAVFLLNVQMGLDFEPARSEPVAMEEIVEEEIAVIRPANHLIRQARALPPQKPLAQFALQSAELSPVDRTYLRRVASLLRMNADQFRSVTLVGHTDPTGPEALNERLSEARARNVKAYLVARGVPENKLLISGRAAKDPVSNELDPNRRVEIRFTSGAPSNLENALRSLQ